MVDLSVIIPTYNRADRLKDCLEALTHQTQSSKDFEVIVVVDGSTDKTIEMLEELKTPYELTFLYQANCGQNNARNYGVSVAKGRFCLFLDDDIVAESHLVAEHLNLHSRQERVVGIGQILLIIKEKDWYTKRFSKGWQDHYDQLNQNKRKPSWTDCYGGNMSLSRFDFLEVNGFASDIRRSHDIELAYRLEKQGVTFVYLPKAVGIQAENKKSHEIFADASKSGYAWVTLCKRHPEILPVLLGPLGETSFRESLLREFFWRCGVTPSLLTWIGRLLYKAPWNDKWYRFIFTYSYWRGVRKAINDKGTWDRIFKGTTILTYHAIGGPEENSSSYILPKHQFKKQMSWLKRMKYSVISLEEYLNYRNRNILPPARTVIITFDDGYVDNIINAFPILRKHKFHATIFLVVDKIGQNNDWARDSELFGRPLLSWSDLAELNLDGVQFGVHSRTHISLPSASEEELCKEIVGTRVELEGKLGVPIRFFAFPFGEYNEKAIEVVVNSGFEASLTVDEGVNAPNTSLYKLRRKVILGTDSIVKFIIKLL
jgi:glycosyltransferase involved in cell wall biosynthesis